MKEKKENQKEREREREREGKKAWKREGASQREGSRLGYCGEEEWESGRE